MKSLLRITIFWVALCFFIPSLSLCSEKTGILFLHVGMNEHYRFASRQFGQVLWDFFPPVLDGADCYTVIHYADKIEAATCAVEEGTPIDIFCNTYTGSDKIHSVLEHGFFRGDRSFFRDCSSDIFPYLFLLMDSTTDPATGERIIGPHVHDGTGIGIPDSSETGAFRSMEKYTRYPGQKDWNRDQELKWWYGNDAPGYDPNPEELTNIKDRLHELLPNTELAFRHGWEMYMKNIDVYGNYFRFADSTETAIEELIQNEGVKKIIVLHAYPSFNNSSQYGHEWYDEKGAGISTLPGKTFKQCIEDITDGVGPATRKKMNEYLVNKPWERHADHPWPLIKRMVEERDPTVSVSFAPAYGTFPEFEQAVLDMLEYTVEKYDIPRTASLKLILGHHGYAGGYMDAQNCDCYNRMVDDLFNRVRQKIMSGFSWGGTFDVVHGANEFSEQDGQDDPAWGRPNGDYLSTGEIIDMSINGQYVNELGMLVNNGDNNFEYILLMPYFFESESSDTLYAAREPLGNNIPLIFGKYGRDDRDEDGAEYDADDLDHENFTVKVFNATSWPSTPLFSFTPVYKGSTINPTTIIVTGAFLSLGNGTVRTNLTEAAARAVVHAMGN